MKTFYAVLDTNVLVSALLKFLSVPGTVFAESLTGKIIPILNKKILAEYKDVLKRPKFKFNSEKVDVFLDDLVKRAIFVDEAKVEEYFPDPKDVVFYAVTLEAKKSFETYLVTGNKKHFPIKTFVVSPREMLDIIS